jgi:hypothetical protein
LHPFLLFGGEGCSVYWIVAMAFEQRAKFHHLLGFSLLASSALLLSACDAASDTAQSALRDTVTTQVRQNCRENAVQTGLSEQLAVRACDCVVTELLDGKSIQEITSLRPADMQPIVRKCSAEVGLMRAQGDNAQ